MSKLTANQADGGLFRRRLHSRKSAVCVFNFCSRAIEFREFNTPCFVRQAPPKIPRTFARHHIAAHSQVSPFSSFQITWDSYRLYNTPPKPV